jgi:hypothetical protein
MVLVPTERFRERVETAPSGYGRYSTGVWLAGSNGIHNRKYESVWDWRRPKSDPLVYPLEILYYEEIGGLLNGHRSNLDFSNFYPAVYQWGNFPHHTNLPGSPSDIAAATQAAARTNPSRPYVDVPVFIFELGDIAQTLRDQGRTVIRQLAGNNLRYQFGIAPIVNDLFKLINFGRALQNRIRELERLKSQRGLRRTVDIGRYSQMGNYEKILQSQGILAKGIFWCNTVEDVKAHCRWIPSADFLKLKQYDVEWLAKKVLHGLTFDKSTVWEAIPWTWIVDYCSTIGNYFKAKRNMVDCQLQSVSVMRHTTTTYAFPGKTHDDTFYFSSSVVKRETKSRKLVTIAPTAHLPFLTANQVGIITSLAITRSRIVT